MQIYYAQFVCAGLFLSINSKYECVPASPDSNRFTCLYHYHAENHHPDCQRASLQDSTKCGLKICDDNELLCYAIYNNRNGKWVPDILDCDKRHPSIAQEYCLNNTCVLRQTGAKYYFECCCQGNLCNKNITLPKPKVDSQFSSVVKLSSTTKPFVSSLVTTAPNKSQSWTESRKKIVLLWLLAPISIGVVLFMIGFYFKPNCKHNCQRFYLQNNDVLLHLPKKEFDSGFIELDILHQGYLSCVKKCMYRNELIALKIVNNKKLWETEKKIYETFINHENILRFMHAKEDVVNHKYFIATEYHSHGSLSEFLMLNTLKLEEMLLFLQCITNGLSFLHSTDLSLTKPVIAHRDLKSSNIFVKSDMTCCIGDFGLALPVLNNEIISVFPDIEQVGTKRYMAPEILEGSIAFCWESFLQADVYSLALVMWELLSRCAFDSSLHVNAYEPVFYNEIGSTPSIQAVIKCVCEEKKRPQLNTDWPTNFIIQSICDTMVESWDEDALARLTASCVYERVVHLQKLHFESTLRKNESQQGAILSGSSTATLSLTSMFKGVTPNSETQ